MENIQKCPLSKFHYDCKEIIQKAGRKTVRNVTITPLHI